VQGNHTCGIDHRPSTQLLDRLMGVRSITSPRGHGVGTVDTIKAMLADDVKVFVSMGSSSSRSPPR
jgi:hypothetical protein